MKNKDDFYDKEHEKLKNYFTMSPSTIAILSVDYDIKPKKIIKEIDHPLLPHNINFMNKKELRFIYYSNKMVAIFGKGTKLTFRKELQKEKTPDFSYVKYLYLNNCSLLKNSNKFISDLKSIELLWISDVKNLKCIINEIAGFPNLKNIHININYPTLYKNPTKKTKASFEFPSFSKDHNFSYLTIDGQIDILPDSIGNLTSLKNISIRNTNLTRLPNSIGDLLNLETFNIYRNLLTELPNTIGNLKNLRSLEIERESLSEIPETIGNLENIEEIRIHRTNLKSLPLNIFNLRKLKNLEITSCDLVEIPDKFNESQELENLSLWNNNLSSLPKTIGNLINLRLLNLDSNQITELPLEICKLVNLTNFFAKDNKLTTLPSDIGNLVNLGSLDLKGNTLNLLPDSFCNLKHLFYLDLSNNFLEPEMVNNSFKTDRELILKELIAKSDAKTKNDLGEEVDAEYIKRGKSIVGSLLKQLKIISLQKMSNQEEPKDDVEGTHQIDYHNTKCLFIGIDYYQKFQDDLKNLKYANRDVAILIEFFLAKGVPNENISLLSDNPQEEKTKEILDLLIPEENRKESKLIPNKSNIILELEKLLPNKNPQTFDTFIFYFAGHGKRYNEKDYLIPQFGAISDNMDHTAISLRLILDGYLEHFLFKQSIIIIDACRSDDTEEGARGDTIGFGKDLIEFKAERRIFQILSCKPTQLSWESDDFKNGVFTHYLHEGLFGKAEDENRRITLSSLRRYLEEKVQFFTQNDKRIRRTQTPQVLLKGEINFSPQDDIIFGINRQN